VGNLFWGCNNKCIRKEREMNTRIILSLLMAVVFAVTTLTCVMAEEKKTLKIGAIFSVTGKASWLGDPEMKTAMMIMEEVNASGGVNGYPLEVIVEDDEGLRLKTVNAVEKLITKDKVLAIIGPSRSGNTMAIKNSVQEAKVPLVSCAAAEAIVDPVVPFVFKTPQHDSHVIIRIYEQMNKMGIRKVGLITGTTGFGKLGRKQAKKYARNMGFEIVADETYSQSDSDMTRQLKKIQDSGAEAVINWSIVPAQSIVPKNMKQLGMKIPLFQSHGFGNPKYIKAAGVAAAGIIFPAGSVLVADSLPAGHWHKKVVSDYKTAYETKYRPPVSTFGGHAYDSLWIVINAMKAKGITPDMPLEKARKLIRDGIEETRGWIGVHGRFNMSPTDHFGLDKDTSLQILVVEEGGKIVPLAAKGTGSLEEKE
jgi:branched-chain amino acid transport system substrate-binding protein